jgi:tubulin-specific chaperone A
MQNRAIDETKAMFPQLRNRIQESLAKLEQQLVSLLRQTSFLLMFLTPKQAQGEQNNPEEITKAQEAVALAKNAIKESS